MDVAQLIFTNCVWCKQSGVLGLCRLHVLSMLLSFMLHKHSCNTYVACTRTRHPAHHTHILGTQRVAAQTRLLRSIDAVSAPRCEQGAGTDDTHTHRYRAATGPGASLGTLSRCRFTHHVLRRQIRQCHFATTTSLDTSTPRVHTDPSIHQNDPRTILKPTQAIAYRRA